MLYSTANREALISEVGLAVMPEAGPDAPASDANAEAVLDRRTADRTALVLLDHVLKWTLADQRNAFRVASRLLGVKLDEDQAEAADAIAACMEAEGLSGAPSREVYRAWWKQEPESREWPSDYAIFKAFGSWSQLRANLDGTPVASLNALALGTLGSPLTEAELLDGLRAWDEEDPDPFLRWGSFYEWAVRRLADSGGRERAGMGKETFTRRFGTWMGSLAAAGLLDGIAFDVFQQVAQCPQSVTDEDLIEHLRTADAWCRRAHGDKLNAKRLKEYRLVKLRENWEAKCWEPVPSAGMVLNRFGGIVEALQAAGILDQEEAAKRTVNRGQKLTQESLVAHVRACAVVNGLDDPALISWNQIRRTRDALVEALGRPVPSQVTIVGRFGKEGWPATARAVASVETDPEEVARLVELYTQALANRECGDGNKKDCEVDR